MPRQVEKGFAQSFTKDATKWMVMPLQDKEKAHFEFLMCNLYAFGGR